MNPRDSRHVTLCGYQCTPSSIKGRKRKREKKGYPKKEMLMDKAYNLWDQSIKQTKGSFCKE